MNNNYYTLLAKNNAKKVRRLYRVLSNIGDNRFCPVCKRSFSKFLPTRLHVVNDAVCPQCESLWRHRLVWLFFEKKTDLFDYNTNKKILHFAPEYCFKKKLKKIFRMSYITADLYDPFVDVKVDITNIPFDSDYFNVLCCSHVLEHVEDDRKAINELYRVLAPGGWALIIVPIEAGDTYEDFTIRDPEGRLKAFGQGDHVRICGQDYVDRIKEAGFIVSEFTADSLIDKDDKIRYGLANDNTILYYCKK